MNHSTNHFRRDEMKTLFRMFVVLCAVVAFPVTMLAQAVGDYRSAAPLPTGGVWNTAGFWQRWNGTAWAVAPSPPSGSQTITIVAGDSIYINVAVTITGTLKNSGRLVPGSPTNLTIGNNGTFEHAQDGGVIPAATWNTGSTCSVTGTLTATSISGGGNQNFYHLVWNCPTQTANTSIGAYGAVIGGNVTLATSNTGRFYFMASSSGTTTVMGNITIQAGAFGTNGTGSLTNDTVFCYGNLVVTGGNFAVSRGSQGGTGTTLWYQYGDVSMSGCVTQNSNATGAKLIFAKQGAQNFTTSNVTYGTGSGSPVNFDVASGTTLNLGSSDLGVSPNSSTGSFRILSGATVNSAHASGLDGNITSSGAQGGGNFFSTNANYGFNGTVQQVTGQLMPDTVADLIINNPTRVRLSRRTTINDTLHLRAGVFDASVGYSLGPNGRISFEGGTIVSVEQPEPTIPQSFFVDQNYPNPFNPSTTIRFGLPNASFVSVKVFNVLGQNAATLFEGHQDAGTYTMKFDAAKLGSGIYFCRVQAGGAVEIRRMVFMK
jgi:hypothetical protein